MEALAIVDIGPLQTEPLRSVVFQRCSQPEVTGSTVAWIAEWSNLSAHKEIEGLELDWRQAQLTNNIPAVERLLADDYLGISANGTLETKADEITRRRSGSLRGRSGTGAALSADHPASGMARHMDGHGT